MTSTKLIVAISILIVSVVGLIFLSFYGLVIFGLVYNKVVGSPIISKKIQAIPPSSQWSTYTDGNLGISLKYPPSWTVEMVPQEESSYYVVRVASDIYKTSPMIGIIIKSGNDPFWKQVQIDRYVNNSQPGKEEVMIDGHKFIRFYNDSLYDGYKLSNEYIYPNSQWPIKFRLYNILTQDYTQEVAIAMNSILDQIVNSITFTNTQ
ncbi:hypothetical protein HYT02_00475 [Candidatus Gottesmanbacteria bacterium]|nr:hypothetical protein [Candidatus Gottesmanbacteria bacterium]